MHVIFCALAVSFLKFWSPWVVSDAPLELYKNYWWLDSYLSLSLALDFVLPGIWGDSVYSGAVCVT